jgi:hypothetical protein
VAVNDSSEARDEVTWGREPREARLTRPRVIRLRAARLAQARPRLIAVAAVIAIGAALGVALGVRALTGTAAPRPAAVHVLNTVTVSFPLRGTSGALLQVRYLRAGRGAGTILPTLVVNGLPRGSDYTVITGVCENSGPRKLSVSSALPDPATDDLVLPLINLPASSRTVVWFTVTNVQGFELGGVRGAVRGLFLPPVPRIVILQPGWPLCG